MVINENKEDMKRMGLTGILLVLLVISDAAFSKIYAVNPAKMECQVQPRYKYHQDGSVGRVVLIRFADTELSGKVTVEFEYDGKTTDHDIYMEEPSNELSVLLPQGAGVKRSCQVQLRIMSSDNRWEDKVFVPKLRHWEIYIYPHSHVDIGYTNTHENVEIIHTRNLIYGLELAKKTKNYPEGARYLWNPEVIWPFDMYLKKATQEEGMILIEGVKDGYLHLDAGYVNLNTSIAGDEEMLEFFRPTLEYEKITGKEIETLVQVDIPGMSWGIVPVAAKLGIKYCFSFNNGYDRVGHSVDHGFKPFWWTDVEGKYKIMFFQAGSYTPGALAKGKNYWPLMAGQTDPEKLIKIVKTDNPRENFIDAYIDQQLPELENSGYYPYDIFAMSWAMADNTPIDADLPEAVRSWNEEYAYPKLRIASASEFMREFDERYGDDLPVRKGDFTEFWTDGAGTAAKQTATNRTSKERLVQAETLWTMLNTGQPAPRDKFNEAWRNIIMGSEHTWCYMAPHQEPIQSDIMRVKFNYFQQAENGSLELLESAVSMVKKDVSSTIAVFNNLSWPRNGIVKIPTDQAKGYNSVVTRDGEEIVSQRLSTGDLVFKASDVPAFGSKIYVLKKKKEKHGISMINGAVLDNGIVRLELNRESGDVSSFIYKGIEYVDQDGKCTLNSYRYLEADDAPDKAFKPENAKIAIKENGQLMATLVAEMEAEGSHKLTSEYTIYEGSENIDIINVVNKIETTDKEGVHFGFAFDIENPTVVNDIPWGMMEIEEDQLWGANRNWITLQRWLNVSNENRSITWCPLDAPVFQVGDITANILGGATKSEKWIKKLEPSGIIYSWALNNHWHTNFQLSQGGDITFRYSLQPHAEGYNYSASNRFATERYQPLVAVPVRKDFDSMQLLSLEGSDAVFTTVFKTCEDGKSAILRLRSMSNVDEKVELNWVKNTPSAVHLIDISDNSLLEELKDEVVVPANDFISLMIRW